jgi:hypothetical protein
MRLLLRHQLCRSVVSAASISSGLFSGRRDWEAHRHSTIFTARMTLFVVTTNKSSSF